MKREMKQKGKWYHILSIALAVWLCAYPGITRAEVTGQPLGACSVWDGSAPDDIADAIEAVNGVYTITAAKQWVWLADALRNGLDMTGKTVALAQDIDLGGAQGVLWKLVPRFSGTFDGQQHTIYNLRVEENGDAGLFAELADAGQLQNVSFAAASVSGSGNVGVAVGKAEGGAQLKGIRVRDSRVSGQGFCGALLGRGGSVADCVVSNCAVTGAGTLGGFAGGVVFAQGCAVLGGTVTDTGTESCAGGFVARLEAGARVADAFANCDVRGAVAVGGFVGIAENADINGCFAMGSVEGVRFVGGFAGRLEGGSVRNAYATGTVGVEIGERFLGGFAAFARGARLESCFAAGEVAPGKPETAGQGAYGDAVFLQELEIDASKAYAGGFVGWDAGGDTYARCAYDKQATGMRETAFGDGTQTPDVFGRCTAGEDGMLGSMLGGFDGAVWRFREGLYPQLARFADGSEAERAFSLASACAVAMYRVETEPNAYDTINDCTRAAKLSQCETLEWTNAGTQGGAPEGAPVVLLSGEEANPRAAGSDTLYATVRYGGGTAQRRLRLGVQNWLDAPETGTVEVTTAFAPAAYVARIAQGAPAELTDELQVQCETGEIVPGQTVPAGSLDSALRVRFALPLEDGRTLEAESLLTAVAPEQKLHIRQVVTGDAPNQPPMGYLCLDVGGSRMEINTASGGEDTHYREYAFSTGDKVGITCAVPANYALVEYRIATEENGVAETTKAPYLDYSERDAYWVTVVLTANTDKPAAHCADYATVTLCQP